MFALHESYNYMYIVFKISYHILRVYGQYTLHEVQTMKWDAWANLSCHTLRFVREWKFTICNAYTTLSNILANLG